MDAHHHPHSSGHAAGCVICASAPSGPGLTLAAGDARSHRAAGAASRPDGAEDGSKAEPIVASDIPRDEYVIEAGWVLADRDDRQVLLRDASVLVRHDRIERVEAGPIAGNYRRVRVPDDLLVPGFISGHTHTCCGTPTRGLIEAGRSYARPVELIEDLDDEGLDDLTAINLAELLRSGCTTQLEMSLSLRQAESYVRVARRWGVRGFPGPMVPGIKRLFHIWHRDEDDRVLHGSVPATLAEIADAHAFAKRHMNAEDGRIVPMMTPHATDTHTPETMQAILSCARELGTGVHIHLSQRVTETGAVRRLWGVTPTEWLRDLGFLDGILFGAHMGGMDLSVDPAIMAASRAVMSTCPSGGGAGFNSQPYPEALAAGMNVNIGIDTHSNDDLENLKLAVVYGKVRARLLAETTPVPLRAPTAEDAVAGATVVAARGLRRPDLGRIAPGTKADLASIDVTGLLAGTGALPPEPLNNLLYANGRMVRHTITDGRFQVFHGRLVVDDEDRVIRRGGAAVRRIWSQLDAEGYFAPPDPASRLAREHLPR